MPNIQDVAKRAKVSPMTVSRVINGSGYVREETRQRVLKAMKELHYVPNRLARSLVVQETKTVALIVPDITNPFFTLVARGTEDTARELGYHVILCNSDEDPVKEREYVEMCISMRVDGIIIAPSGDASKTNLQTIEEFQIPFVCVDREVPGIAADVICGDSYYGSYQLVRHLIELGHKYIAIVTNLRTSTGRDRLKGYQDALRDYGLTFSKEYLTECTYKSVSQQYLVDTWWDLSHPPTAVFAVSNFMAMEIYKGLARRGVRVPDDFAMVCFDDIISFPEEFFTTAKQPSYNIGSLAMQSLMDRLKGHAIDPRKMVLKPEIAIRRSSGRPR
ncbi:LacI family DNA-binding transcriptional regulator [Alicyclobacillus herbarius]|uniref:LacI family DNA-binding transcriptional regulator n=1 Tax=Alicyclobacillus herbarius TaxID=122960 RepID=UPI00040D2738|nr:LacI family DNA-binding transcriptional regulator [Alicyclobacillus herbarius]